MNHCKDCDRPLTTYQGINQRPEDAEVYCEYCEANPPTHDDIVEHVTSQQWGEVDPNEYTDFGKPFTLGPEARQQIEDRMTRIGPHNVLLAEDPGSKFHYVEHSDNFANHVADKIYKDLNKPWREAPPVYLSLHASDPGNGPGEIGDLIHPSRPNGYARQPTTFSDPRAGCNFNERRATWVADKGWPLITHFGVYDAKQGGNLLFHSQLDREIETEEGDSFEFLPGSVKIQIT